MDGNGYVDLIVTLLFDKIKKVIIIPWEKENGKFNGNKGVIFSV